MLMPIHSPAKGRMRVIGYASGSGNTLWKAYELQKDMEKKTGSCPFEIVGVFTDNPAASCVSVAEQFSIPVTAMDIRAFYKEREKPLRDREVRKEYDHLALEALEAYHADVILLAGYVWATTDAVLDRYLVINVHPADLSIVKDGRRAYAGANGVGDALKANEPYIASSSHVATKELDAGPLLIISEKIPVDYTLHEDDETRMRYYLKLVNNQSRLVGARTLLEVASGCFAVDENNRLHHQGKLAPTGLRIENWNENIPTFERDTDKLIHPNSVAVLGASTKPGLGQALLNNILRDGFKGDVYAVNTRGEEVLGVKGYPTLADIPGEVELAVIAVPSKAVPEMAEQCGKKGVKALICITAGFGEMDEAGKREEQKLLDIVNRYNMRMIGPNCMGLLNTAADLNATMLTNRFTKGNIALVTQSGAIGAAILDCSSAFGIGFSTILSLGNQADVNACDILELLEKDPNTKVILMYLESVLNPVQFLAQAARMETPILLLKSGKTAFGAGAASSHTGSLAGNDEIVEALIQKAGILRMPTLESCFVAASALSKLPWIKGKRVALLTNAGGPGILISDMLFEAGFEMPKLSEKTREILAPKLFKEASLSNPIDLVAAAPPEHYAIAAKEILSSGEYDVLLVCCVPPAVIDTTLVAEALVPVVKESSLPVLTSFMGPTLGDGGRRVMLEAGIPAYEYPEQSVEALISLKKPEKFPQGVYEIPKDAQKEANRILAACPKDSYLPIMDAIGLLAAFGLDMPGCALIKEVGQLESLSLRYPVVAKIEHPDIVHKSDVGGVKLNIQDAAQLRETVQAFLEKFAGATGVFVQEMAPKGVELIVGSVRDENLGNAVMIGLGGTWVEVFKDVAFGYPPISKELALSMIHRLKCEKLLKGYRGSKGVNIDALADMLTRLGNLLLCLPGVKEMDLNPIIYDPDKDAFVPVDVRIRI